MDYSTLTSLIGSVGFPIVACCVMFQQNSKLQETLSQLAQTLVTISERLSDVENSLKGDNSK